MNSRDPRGELDQFTSSIVQQFSDELEIAIKSLISANAQIALSQIDILEERAVKRLTGSELSFRTDLARISPSDLPDPEVVKLIQIVVDSLKETFNHVREHIVECEKSIYGSDDDPVDII